MIKLEEEVKEDRVIEVTVRPALYALKCGSCEKTFGMRPFCNDSNLAVLLGTFADCATDPETGKGMGNAFQAEVCSFECAHEIFALGGWKRLEKYEPFAKADIPLIRGELRITAFVEDDKELRRKWKEKIK